MSFNPAKFPDILTNEETMNTRLTILQAKLRNILDDNEISYSSNDGIIQLIAKLPYPTPTSIECDCYKTWLTKDGHQSGNKSAVGYPIVRDQNGTYMPDVPITVRRKPIGGGTWSDYGTYLSSNDDVYFYPDANTGGYVYELYVTDKPSVSTQLTFPQYWFNYEAYNEDYMMTAVLDTSNPIISNNVKFIDVSVLNYGGNYFYITPNSSGELLLAIPLRNAPAIVGADSNTDVYIGYDIKRGDTPSSDSMFGVGGGMVGNGSRNSMGVFLDSSDADFISTDGSSFHSGGEDIGFSETGVFKECIVHIPGGSSGTYTRFENNNASISENGPYWYESQLGSRYGPCLVVYHNNAVENQRIKVTIKYIRAICP